MVTALHHVNITVPPQHEAAAKEFYGSILRLKQISKPLTSRSSGAWYQVGEVQLHMSVEERGNVSLSSAHVCFTVSDLAEAEQIFRAAGVPIIADARPNATTPRFYVRDPGGNQLEIAQQK